LPAAQLTASAAYNFARNLRLWLWLPDRFGVLLSQTAALEPLVYIGAWIAALALGALLWRVSHNDAWLAGALAWVLLFLLPLINLVPLGVTPVAMHYLILPGVGLAWLATRALAELSRRFPRQNLGRWIGVAVLLSWQPAFRHTLVAFRTDIGLYEASLANYPDNMEVRVNLIAAYAQAGATTQAQQLLDISLERAPHHPGLLELQLQSLVRGEQTNEALAWLDVHAELVRSKPSLSLHRALVLQKLGRTSEAQQAFLHVLAIATQPELRALAGYQLANLLVQARRLHEAHALLRELHDELPDNADITLALRLLDDVVR
jgi:tetratricopeptide (TPR) repeat protein